MSAGWVAAGVRARGIARRALGREAVFELASSRSLEEALGTLVRTPYGREVRTEMDLASAERAVWATALWHTRVLAGWCPPMGAGALRMLAAGYEIANITGQLRRLEGHDAPAPYVLGSLAISWPAVSRASTPGEVRDVLASSAWGDPGSEDPATIRLALLLGWARRVLDDAPGAADWAISGAALLVARVLAADVLAALGPAARRDADRLIGSRWHELASLDELPGRVPRAASNALEGVTGTGDLWRAEMRWWSTLDTTGSALAARAVLDASPVVGVVGVLAADAWLTRAALEMSARGGGDLSELLDAVA